MIKLKVHPKNMDESYLIQKAAFAAGYRWSYNGQKLETYSYYWITVRPEEKILKRSGPVFSTSADFTEKSVAEILHMLGVHYGIDCTVPEGT